MKISFFKPHQLLSSYIDRYWSWENDESGTHYLPHIPPGVSVDLYFHYRKPFTVAGRGMLSSSHVIHSGENSSRILPSDQIGFIVVRFRCGMFGNFSSVPLHELADTFADAAMIWGEKGRQLEEQIATAASLEERVRLIESFLLRQLSIHQKPASVWNWVSDQLYYHHDEMRLEQLAKKMKITPRHFRRAFREASGLTPKRFQQLSRFHTVLKQLLIKGNLDYHTVALHKGYYDQMHFIKEFKQFMNETPSVFLNQENINSHFYYPSW